MSRSMRSRRTVFAVRAFFARRATGAGIALSAATTWGAIALIFGTATLTAAPPAAAPKKASPPAASPKKQAAEPAKPAAKDDRAKVPAPRANDPKPAAAIQFSWAPKEIYQWLRDGKHDLLEQHFAGLREEKPGLSNGMSGLGLYYEVLLQPDTGLQGATPDSFEPQIARLTKWKEAKPKSVAALITLAKCHLHKGWAARGGGFAGSVTEKGWQVFRDELTKANEILEEAKKLDEKDPALYETLIDLGKGLSWERPTVDAALKAGMEVDPLFYPLYRAMTEYLLPRWHGEPGDVEKFADDSAKKVEAVRPGRGKDIYARIALHVWNYEGIRFFQATTFSYASMREGWQVLKTSSPQAAIMWRNMCLAACLSLDRETAAEIFAKLQFVPGGSGFGGQFGYDSWKRWATDPNLPQGQDKRTIVAHTWVGSWVSYLGDRFVISAGRGVTDGLRLWEVQTGKLVAEMAPGLLKDGVICAAVDPQGRYAIAGGGIKKRADNNNLSSSELFLIAMRNRDAAAVPLAGHKERVKSAAVSPDGERFFTGADDGTAFLWTYSKIAQPVALQHKDAVRYAAFSSDGAVLVTGGSEPIVRFWNAEDGKLIHEIDTEAGPVKRLALHPSEPVLAVACGDNKLRFYDTKTWQKTAEADGPEGDIYTIAYSPNGKLLALGDYTKYLITLYDADTHAKLHTLAGHWGGLRWVCFSPDSKTLASTADDWTVKLWDVAKFVK